MKHYEDFESKSDEELAMCFFEGSMPAFNVLHARYSKYITYCCYKVVGNQDVAEEVAQDTFVRAAQKIHYFLNNNEKRNFKAWIWKMAKNLSINRRRSENRRKFIRTNLSSSQLDKSQSSNEPDPAKLLEIKESHRILHEAADELPEPTRTYFADHYFREIPRKKIARIYELLLHQVDHHLKRGRTIVKKKILKIMLDKKNRN
jgi:RNA polymerase sigma-70 factor (ECF subfamily)